MLITFSVENWRCFKDEVTLNMTAGRERQHLERLPTVKPFGLKLLPISAIYGANASGKTKLIEALAFLQQFVILGTQSTDQRIPVQRFKLDSDYLSKPVKFSVDALIDEKLYSYTTQILPEAIVEESLVIETASKSLIVFKRNEKGKIVFGKGFFSPERLAFMEFISQATRKNQLFLTTAIQLGAFELEPLYNWFKTKLIILTPTSEYLALNRFVDPSDELNAQMIDLIRKFGTSIDHFISQPINESNPLDAKSIQLNIYNLVKDRIPQNTPSMRIMDLFTTQSGDETTIKRLVAIHKNKKEDDILFSLREESEGTRRLLALIPAFVELRMEQNFVYVIDELDRSLHTQLLEWLIRYYLNSCGEGSRSQLIFTTHDVNLLTQNLFRRDELWGVQKNFAGESDLYSFREFKDIRQDKDIRKIYLNGLIGAVPDIG